MNLEDILKIGKYIFKKKYLLGTTFIIINNIIISYLIYLFIIVLEDTLIQYIVLNKYIADIIVLICIKNIFIFAKINKIKNTFEDKLKNNSMDLSYLIIILYMLYFKNQVKFFNGSNNDLNFYLTLLLWIIILMILKKIIKIMQIIYDEVKNSKIKFLDNKCGGNEKLYINLINLYNNRKANEEYTIISYDDKTREMIELIKLEYIQTLDNIELLNKNDMKIYFSEEVIKHFENEEAEQ